MKAGDICKRPGQWCCGYHQKRKIKIKEGEEFPPCNFQGLNCEGFWCFLKEVKQKTIQEITEAANWRRYRHKHHRDPFEEDKKARLKAFNFKDWDKW